MKDAFERRRTVTQRYTGRIVNSYYDEAYTRLVGGGWTIRVFLNGREIKDWSVADPDAGTVSVTNGMLKGNVEIRMTRVAKPQPANQALRDVAEIGT